MRVSRARLIELWPRKMPFVDVLRRADCRILPFLYCLTPFDFDIDDRQRTKYTASLRAA